MSLRKTCSVLTVSFMSHCTYVQAFLLSGFTQSLLCVYLSGSGLACNAYKVTKQAVFEMGLGARKSDFVAFKQQRHRSAFTY